MTFIVLSMKVSSHDNRLNDSSSKTLILLL